MGKVSGAADAGRTSGEIVGATVGRLRAVTDRPYGFYRNISRPIS